MNDFFLNPDPESLKPAYFSRNFLQFEIMLHLPILFLL